jgi:D-alanine-D-alanine ligase
VYDYRLKHHPTAWREVSLRCPPTFPAETVAAARLATRRLVGALGLRDVGRFDFRLGNDGRLWLLEINALPLLDPDGTSVVRSAALEGLSFEQLILHIVNTAAARRP